MSKNTVKSFALAFGNLPGNIQGIVKEEIMDECGWNSPQIFSMKMYGRRGLTENEHDAVSRIMHKHGFNAFSGEPIKESV